MCTKLSCPATATGPRAVSPVTLPDRPPRAGSLTSKLQREIVLLLAWGPAILVQLAHPLVAPRGGPTPRHVPYRALWLAPPLAQHRRCHAPALFRHGAGRAGRFGSDQRDPRSRARTPARGRAATPGRAMWSLGNRLRSRQRPPMRIRSYPAKAPHAASASSATYHRACGSVHQPGRRFRAHGSPRGCSITRRPPVSTTWPSCSRPPTASKMLSP